MQYSGLHFFEDSGDMGDQYNYSPALPAGETTTRSIATRITCQSAGPVKAVYRVEMELSLPEALGELGTGESANVVNNRIVTTVTLRANSPRIEFHTLVDNRSRDHRLTVAFPTGVRTEAVNSGSQFGINTRPVILSSAADWNEKPNGFYPHHRFLHIADSSRGFAFMDRGLTEHKVDGNGDVFVTLLRCTSHLSKDTLPERGFSHAGPGMPTPLGQELGHHEYDYAIYLGEAWESWEIARRSAEFAAPIRPVHLAGGKPEQMKLPDSLGMLKLEGNGVMLSAVKRAKDGGLIVRLYNNRDCPVEACIVFFKPVKLAALTNLLERPVLELQSAGGRLALDVGPHKIMTVSVMLED